MGLIPQTKCSRCDRRYSGLRSRCPYCGSRRRKKGKRSTDTDNATWKLVIGILLVVVLIAAVVVLLVTSLADAGTNTDDTQKDDGQQEIINNVGDGVSSLPGTAEPDDSTGGDTEPDADDEPDEPVATTPTVESAKIVTVYGSSTTDFTVSIGKSEQLTIKTTPEDADVVPKWESSDTSIFAVVPTDSTGMSATVTALGKGWATLTVTVGEVTVECYVRVNG